MTKSNVPPRQLPPQPPRDPRFARDVAKQLDRRRVRRRVTLWTALLGLVAAAAMYLRCGTGFGLGGLGGFTGAGGERGDSAAPDGSARPAVTAQYCSVRVSSHGISVAGKSMTRDQAVRACKPIGSAHVVVTGDAREGDWIDLRAALDAAAIKHQP
jgi:hypothetical protein